MDAPAAVADAAVVIFARLPIPGQAKTRLGAGVGAAPAAAFYRAMVGRCRFTLDIWDSTARRTGGVEGAAHVRAVGGEVAG